MFGIDRRSLTRWKKFFSCCEILNCYMKKEERKWERYSSSLHMYNKRLGGGGRNTYTYTQVQLYQLQHIHVHQCSVSSQFCETNVIPLLQRVIFVGFKFSLLPWLTQESHNISTHEYDTHAYYNVHKAWLTRAWLMRAHRTRLKKHGLYVSLVNCQGDEGLSCSVLEHEWKSSSISIDRLVHVCFLIVHYVYAYIATTWQIIHTDIKHLDTQIYPGSEAACDHQMNYQLPQ